MVNDLRAKARSGEVLTTIASTDEESAMMVRTLNRAARTVLESHQWPFDVRDDGHVLFDAPFTISDATGSTVLKDNTNVSWASQADYAEIVARLHGDPWRLLFTDAATYPNTSYRVLNASGIAFSGGTVSLLISPGYLDATTNVEPDLYFFQNEALLPTTVRRVLSVRHQERPLQLDFVERHVAFDRAVPRQFDRTGQPEWVYVGGSVTSTYDTDQATAGTTGIGMMVWPLPNERTKLDYSYVYRHPELVNATDTLAGVPDRIVDLIVDRAWLYMLTSNAESDPALANQVRADWDAEYAEAKRQMRTDPLRRRIPHRGFRRSPWAEWDQQEIPSS